MKFLKTLKEYLTTILTIIFVIAIFIFIFIAVKYLKKSDKKLQIVPKFKVIDAKKEDNLDTLNESVDIAKDILSKVKK
jgi:hypothetical protein